MKNDADLWVSRSSPAEIEARMAALAAYDIVGSEPEHAFDEIVFIASHVFRTPVALVSLVEENRQWFKARVGFDACETPIDQSVCQHGLNTDDLLVIPDLTADPRTCNNTLVTDGPKIRFYAGAPLVAPGGVPIGMLCVIDDKVRPGGLDGNECRMLRAMADQVVTQLELRRSLRATAAALEEEREESDLLRQTLDRLRLAGEAGNVGVFEMTLGDEWVAVNSTFCEIYGVETRVRHAAGDLAGQRRGTARVCFDEIPSDPPSGTFVDEFEIVRKSDGERRWIQRSAQVIRDDAGCPVQFIGVIADLTEQRAVSEEIAHRLKNTLAIVQAIIRHSLRDMAEPELKEGLIRRISALGTAHDLLLSRTHSSGSLHGLAEGVFRLLSLDDRIAVSGADVELSPRVLLSLSMVLHELGTNAMKYGAMAVPGGSVSIVVSRESRDGEDWLVLRWRESGGPVVTPPQSTGLGTRLVERGFDPEGDVRIDFAPGGLSVEMAAPVSRITA